jgi:hypothetical protein
MDVTSEGTLFTPYNENSRTLSGEDEPLEY